MKAANDVRTCNIKIKNARIYSINNFINEYFFRENM